MTTEAPFSAKEATKRWGEKLARGLGVNLFLITLDIMRIHLGSQWQNKSLKLDGGDFEIYSLEYTEKTLRLEQINVSVVYMDQKQEDFLLSRRESPKGRNRYSTFVWIPAQYYRTPGGVQLTDGHYVKTFLDRDPTQTMVNRLWYAHLYTLDKQENQPLEHLKIKEIPKIKLN